MRDTGEEYQATDASGAYSFQVTPGVHVVRSETWSRWQNSSPIGGSHTITVASDDSSTGNDFGVYERTDQHSGLKSLFCCEKAASSVGSSERENPTCKCPVQKRKRRVVKIGIGEFPAV